MTDTTAFTAQMGCLLFGVLSLRERRHSGACLALSLALGLFAYTVREAALAAPLAVLAGRFVAYPGSKARRRSILLLALRSSSPSLSSSGGTACLGTRNRGSSAMLPTTRVEAPARSSPWRLRFRRHFSSCWRRARRAAASRWSAAAALATLFLGTLVAVRSGGGLLTLFSGNALTRVGAVDVSLPGRPVLFSEPVWAAMTLLALVARPCWRAFSPTGSESSRLGPVRGSLARAAAGSAPKIVVAVYLLLSIAFLILGRRPGLPGSRPVSSTRCCRAPDSPSDAAQGRAPRSAPPPCRGVRSGSPARGRLSRRRRGGERRRRRWEAGKAPCAGTAATAVDAGFEWMGWHYRGSSATGPVRACGVTRYLVQRPQVPVGGQLRPHVVRPATRIVVEPHRSPGTNRSCSGEAVPLRLRIPGRVPPVRRDSGTRQVSDLSRAGRGLNAKPIAGTDGVRLRPSRSCS